MKKFIALFIVIFLLGLSLLPVNANTSEYSNIQNEIQNEYVIKLEFSKSILEDAALVDMLARETKESLKALPKGLLNESCSFLNEFLEKYGALTNVKIIYIYRTDPDFVDFWEPAKTFDGYYSGRTIYMFIANPKENNILPTEYETKYNRRNIRDILIHEVGHLFADYAYVKNEDDKFIERFANLSADFPYVGTDKKYIDNMTPESNETFKKTYISNYAATEIKEDFAEMFKHLFIPRSLIRNSINEYGQDIPVYQKAKLVADKIAEYCPSTRGTDFLGRLMPEVIDPATVDSYENLQGILGDDPYIKGLFTSGVSRENFMILLFQLLDFIQYCDTSYPFLQTDDSEQFIEITSTSATTLVKSGIMSPVNGNESGSNKIMTRGEAAVAIYNSIRFFKKDLPETRTASPDQATATAAVTSLGIMSSRANNTLGLNAELTYNELYVILNKLLDYMSIQTIHITIPIIQGN